VFQVMKQGLAVLLPILRSGFQELHAWLFPHPEQSSR